MKKWKIAVLMGGMSVEHDISLRSGATVLGHLPPDKFETRAVVIHRDGSWSLAEEWGGGAGRPVPGGERGLAPEGALGRLRAWGIDAAFLALHGPFGEDGTVQGFFQTAGIPYTCSGVEACAAAMNKFFCKVLARWIGLRIPQAALIAREEWRRDLGGPSMEAIRAIGFPAFVKPLRQGSSLGMKRVDDPESLREAMAYAFEFDSDLLIEREIAGREITCGVLGGGRQPVRALPPVEIRPIGKRFFDFESKYDPDKAEEICPASLTPREEKEVREAAAAIYRTVGARGMARIDFMLDEEGPWFLELNPIPGLTPESIILKEAAAAGLPLDSLLETLVLSALETGERSP